MRWLRRPSSSIGLLTIALWTSWVQAAAILPEDRLSLEALRPAIQKRCDNPCGFYGQVCCQANEACITNNGQAQCGPGGGDVGPANQQDGSWQVYTTTYVTTDLQTITATMSSYVPQFTQNVLAPTIVPDHGQCSFSLGEVPCGSKCCSSGQYCKTDVHECAAADGDSSELFNTFVAVPTPSAPIRPTSNTVFTVTATGDPSTTVPYEAPVGTDGSTLIGLEPASREGGLSSGAIAGIVIGVIAGIILLLLICFCCCAKGAVDGILGLFRGRRRNRRETTYVEERRHHRSSRHGGGGRSWYGSRPTRTDRRKSSTIGPMAKVGAGLATLGAGLGIKRRIDQRRAAKSDSSYTRSDIYYDDTSSSE